MTTETKTPARIFLQVPEYEPGEVFSTDGVTWCQDSVNDTDVEYVRADLALPMPVLREEDRAAQVAERQDWMHKHAVALSHLRAAQAFIMQAGVPGAEEVLALDGASGGVPVTVSSGSGQLAWDARQAMIDYGIACVKGDAEAVRDSTTRACAAIDALAAAAHDRRRAPGAAGPRAPARAAAQQS